MIRTEAQVIKELSKTPPVECDLKVGDIVTYTNEFGVKFEGQRIIGFSKTVRPKDRFIHLHKDAYWFPVRLSEVKKES